jgi:hypothetical protein
MGCITARIIEADTGETVTIRPAHPDDAVPLLAYIRSVAADTAFFIMQADEFNFTDEQERHWIQDHIEGPGKLALVAEASGSVIGLSMKNPPHQGQMCGMASPSVR